AIAGTAAAGAASPGGAGDANAWCVLAPAGGCEASSAAAGTVDAGDRFVLEDPTLDGSRLLVVDPAANQVIHTANVA
ncbi:MAG TPA: hypothetical protein VNX21_01715, partial [Candidatus Thermoplasmatota archaeon]|nr:hypothetical protein [Candidatus Thermoplasmatota archaeon]